MTARVLALRVPTSSKAVPKNQGIRKHRSPTSRHTDFPLDEITLYFANKRDPSAKRRYVKLLLHEEYWLPLIRSLGIFTTVTNAVGG